GWSSSPPTARSCSLQSTFGPSSTSRSSIDISQPSTISTPRSQSDVARCSETKTPSLAPPNSIGGQNPSTRANQPEIVSFPLIVVWTPLLAQASDEARNPN